ncbi:translocase [Pseudorhodobacter sp.]|uniref:preprotein translocase subunit SecA n=1 Tax=Pseudorhodobacter sp. TaxID=1934400 RepID=UPI0026494703|nr:translocase [Pseudorhodobacter sp.]MDN5787832.1 translocase [Pseudorhodobacter sp.]
MSDPRLWQIKDRADTVEPERRPETRHPSDEFIRRMLAPLRRAVFKPGVLRWFEVWQIRREGRRMEALATEALAARVRATAPQLLRDGLTGRPLRIAVAGVREMTFRMTGKRHHPVQIIGGLGLLRGRIVEMATGEGKTLTTLIPAVVVALVGIPVHVVTVNSYLAQRDADTLAPVLAAFGLRHGVITDATEHHLRPEIYGRDVVFSTNSDIAFDYLRDRLALGHNRTALSQVAQRILSTKAGRDSRRILTRGLGFAVVDEVDSILIDEAQTPLIITAQRPGDAALTAGEDAILALAASLEEGRDFQLDRKKRTVRLMPVAEDMLTGFVPPTAALVPEPARREALVQALSALHLYIRDEHYILNDDGLVIVDEFTGRVMPDRQWQSGLHQLIEAKEKLDRSGRRETLAQITYQTFFARYLWFAGMTGTATEVARELRQSHGRAVFQVPSNRRSMRRIWPTRLFGSEAARWHAVVAEAKSVADRGRAVLIGTRSVAASEHLAALLRGAGLDPQVLNARQDADEAALIAMAGEPGRITVATNMAGRGTDIPVGPEVEARGGLHVILTEFHGSARIDRQLIGRAARQGQRGSARAIVSLNDALFSDTVPRLARLIRVCSFGFGGRLPGLFAESLRKSAQKRTSAQGRRRRSETVRRAERQQKSLGFRPDNI